MPRIAVAGARSDTRTALIALLVKLVRPLVLLMLKHGMTAYEFGEISRWVFVHAAMDRERFAVNQRDVWSMTKSRCAVLTGLTRRAVDDLAQRAMPPVEEARRAFHRGVRVLDAWMNEPGYQDEQGRPRDLHIKGPQGSLQWLVRNYCRDIPVRAMLDDLEHRGCVTRHGRDVVRFIHADFDGAPLAPEEIELLGGYAENLLSLLGRRLDGAHPLPGFTQIATASILAEHREAVQLRLTQAMETFVAQIRRELASYPKALVAQSNEEVVVGIHHGFV
ncbi:MAG TPA: DUF6502 family protein [Gammaproteobacteria bacterium]